MTRAFGDHMRQRRLQIFDFVHHHALDLTDGMVFHISQRRMQKTIRQTQAQPLQYVIGHVMRNAGGQCEGHDLDPVCQQRPQAPASDPGCVGPAFHKQANDPIHTVKRRQSDRYTDHR